MQAITTMIITTLLMWVTFTKWVPEAIDREFENQDAMVERHIDTVEDMIEEGAK